MWYLGASAWKGTRSAKQTGMRKGELERGLALDTARRDIALRLRRVCENFAEDDFLALVDQMATIEVKYRLRDQWLTYRPPTAREQIIH